jgi:hypothetical protein
MSIPENRPGFKTTLRRGAPRFDLPADGERHEILVRSG